MSFLKRKREEDAKFIQKAKEQSSKRKSSKAPNREISDFFSRSPDEEHNASSMSQPDASTESYVSWSVSPRSRQISMNQRSGHAVQTQAQSKSHTYENDKPTHSRSIDPNSSVSNRLLNITTDALLQGVDVLGHGRKKYYSLEDLKVLAGEIKIEFPGDQYPSQDPQLAETLSILATSHRSQTGGREMSDARDAELPQNSYNFTPAYAIQNAVGDVSRHLYEEQQPHPMPQATQLEAYHRSPLSTYTPASRMRAPNLRHGEHLRGNNIDGAKVERQDRPWVNWLEDREASVYDDALREPKRQDIKYDSGHLPITQESVIASFGPDDHEAGENIEAITAVSCDLDAFDKALLRHNSEDILISEEQPVIDNTLLQYAGRLESAPGTPVESWPRMALGDIGQDVGWYPVGSHFIRGASVDNRALGRGQRGPGVSGHGVNGSTIGFSGFSRAHILY